jgi:predicted nuclease of restriction endonuclease-like (RecB) superfamily
VHDSSTIISNEDSTNLKIKINKLFDTTDEWFAINLLLINYENPCFLQFQTKKGQLSKQISSNSSVS